MRVTHVLLFLLAVGAVAQDVETVVKLLQELRQEAVDELARLGDRLLPIQDAKRQSIQILTQARLDQNGECYNRQQDVEQKQAEIEAANAFKQWMRTRQSILSQNVCEHNNNYIDNVKNARILLRLIAFLRSALQTQLGQPAMLQTKQGTLSEIAHIVNIYKEYRHNSALIQAKQEEGDGEFNLNGTVEQLIEMLNCMEREIQNDIANGQNGSVQVGVTFSEFKLRLQKENEVFDRQIQVQDDLIANFQNQLVTLQSRVEKCNARLSEVNTALLTAEEDLRYLLDGYDEDRKRIQEEIDLFDWLIRHYQGISEPEPDARRADEEGEEDSEGDGSVIDYTPEDEKTGAWDSSAASQDEEESEEGSVIDYTPENEDEGAWLSEPEFLQKEGSKIKIGKRKPEHRKLI